VGGQNRLLRKVYACLVHSSLGCKWLVRGPRVRVLGKRVEAGEGEVVVGLPGHGLSSLLLCLELG